MWDRPGAFEALRDNQSAQATIRGAHISLRKVILYGCNFAEDYGIKTLRMSYVYTKHYEHMKLVLHTRVCSASKQLPLDTDSSKAIHEYGYQIHLSLEFWAGVCLWGGIVNDVVILGWCLTLGWNCQRCRHFGLVSVFWMELSTMSSFFENCCSRPSSRCATR
jgi:hypothetical protein